MRIVLKDVRGAFLKIAEPEAFPGGTDPTRFYSGSFILVPTHPQLAEIRAAIKSVAAATWPTNTGAILEAADKMGKLALHDGATKPDMEGYAGNFYISARTSEKKGKPRVYGLGGQKAGEIRPGDKCYPYSGCYLNVIITLFAYGGKPGIPKGVGAGLGDIQFVRDGDAFSGAKPASADEFADISVPLEAGAEPEAPKAAGGNPWD